MGIKEGLALVIERARQRENAELLPRCNDEAPAEPGRWTVKDTLAHLTAWRMHAAAVVGAVRRGSSVPQIDDINKENAAIYAASKDLPAAAIVVAAAESWRTLADAIEASSEDVLRSPRPGRPGQLVWEVVPGNAHVHLAEHLGYLAEAHNDPDAAEAAARWAHDLDNEALPEPRQRANADYNLACYYTRRGRLDDALPLLRRAFTVNPDLKAWAQKDSDLDPVRDRAELAGVLA
jgi:tetratricopeptide (TPR) repeat protein